MALRAARRSLPVVQTPRPSLVDDSFIDEALGDGGHLARLLPGYESRPCQLAMSRAIEQAIRERRHLFVEAPCGVGKGLAYLVPAIRNAVERGQKAVIATATINLQHQLVEHDLPLLREALPAPFTFAIAKGRANFACWERFEDEDARGVKDARWRLVREWISRTVKGDVSELPFEPGALKSKFTVSAEDCMGRACPSRERCFSEKARDAYFAADVVVTNYHLFFLDLMIHGEEPDSGPLPAWGLAVFDEVHRAADIARDLLGYKVTRGAVDNVARALTSARDGAIDEQLGEDLRAEAGDFFSALLSHRKSDAYKVRLRAPGEVGVDHLASLLDQASTTLFREVGLCEDGRRRARVRQTAQRASVLASQVRRAGELFDPERFVYCVDLDGDEGERQRASLVCKLIWPADVLRERLFDVPGRVVAMTSATLAVDGSFDFIAREMGAEKARELIVPTPFDFARQAILVIPRGMPDPKMRDDHERYVAEQLVEVARLSRGRLLGLFTSNRGLRRAADAFRSVRFAGISKPWGSILVQGEAPRQQLVERFKREIGSILLGVESFWEGIDVPGEALSVVVIDRLPFATPDDPILDAVDMLLPRGAFEEWSKPRAILSVVQGAGRLIRSKADRGAVVVLDERILTKGYGKAFLRSLPPMPLSRRLEDVGSFLGAFPARQSTPATASRSPHIDVR